MQDTPDDFTTRQWLYIILHKLGMPRTAERVLEISEDKLEFYINIASMLGKKNEEIQEILAYSNIA